MSFPNIFILTEMLMDMASSVSSFSFNCFGELELITKVLDKEMSLKMKTMTLKNW